ncbi:helical backbone metal receptor [Streptomyces tsukubensis]|uniref:Cobalamin-binding protein n=1 Tax=Streptomyces tsukubensis TaxID=83656 RepID=A0A1V4AE30_9ACTN|nr:helical backbone metal receptor [Streptomyces tsukubensis]OON82235.1 cobalamin-binding protein [Streptomyces tsukubensis]QFR92726.1 ABC transporter substrate-binding protein [Streptomyces tsukubensis]
MRVVSLVPSLTETVAVTAPGLLTAVTDWCTHPAGLDGSGVLRIGGTKNPDVARIVALAPDLVLANEEENRPQDLAGLREAGIEVLVTEVRTLPDAFTELARVLAACGLTQPRWFDEARAVWSEPQGLTPRARAVVPIWRRPWMVLGRDTFAGDLLDRLGVDHVHAGHAERYPRIPLETLCSEGADLVVLPDEPYRFTRDDGPESFPVPAALVSGRHLTWYGPSLAEAPRVLGPPLLRAAHGC